MGLCNSSMSAEEKEAIKRSKAIEAQNAEAFRLEQEKIKLLLLGAGESGKSTIFKQMKVLYGAPMTDEEQMQFTPVVYSNTILGMKTLVNMTETFGYQGEVVASAQFNALKDVSDDAEIDAEVGGMVKALWEDPGIQHTWERRAEFQIVESVVHYFQNIDRIMQPGYVATQQDILFSRVRTSGIVEEKYIIDGAQFVMFDVGGQRNERKKWIHCFDDVTAVIFVAALSEYDQALYEDSSTNRMTEAIDLFDEICNNKFFINSSMILFLNKRDLFEQKIARVAINSVPEFSDCPGGVGDYDGGVEYFLTKFLAVNRDEDKEIYHHVTCATDTGNVKHVFNACKDIILRDNLRGSGFME